MKTSYYRLIITSFIIMGLAAPVFGQSSADEARKHLVRGMAAIEMAKSEAELTAAAAEFKKATELAPTMAAAWYNLGSVQSKMGQLKDAIASYRRYVILAPKADDAQLVNDEIIKLEYRLERASIELVFVKGGCFDMGDTFGDGLPNEKPAHNVCVSDFYMGKQEVTQGQWKAIMGNNPSHFTSCGDTCPVESVSWNDIQDFIQELNSKTSKSYRLPTEAEWEYAARSGGKKEKYAGTSSESSLGSYAWYKSNSGSKTYPVGQKQPNSLGLYDMSGNVWEWVSDWYDKNYYSSSPRDNPGGPSSGYAKVLRGGGWADNPRDSRASFRHALDPSGRYDGPLGFRVALSAR
ncbi:MAG: formylglycine-generating enzyme family protein [Syntrophus sp. (in: bacteria)]|nr:formylglycine-generating enzyme family protein [Syntrophus sp. (in: bacteria)]